MIDVQDYLKDFRYCEDLYQYSSRPTREVAIGGIPLGGDNPIRIQSMTIANTRDTEATIQEVMQLADAGCDYVRITAPSKKEAENLRNIKNGLRAKGYETPLVADIHFTPNAAEIAAQIVEKVRINPGNYADKKRFQVFEFSDEAYQAELERIKEKFVPLVQLCKEHGTAMRIGTNHGSLSDRIMNRYGDTPEGMVESAMEFLRICEEQAFYDIVLSMKASNPKVMVEAYRLLVAKMNEEDMHYPLHLGVTEAGDGEEARIKSATGIGTLLEDGLGDTIRVSLTEDSVHEPAVARKLAARYPARVNHKPIPHLMDEPFGLNDSQPAFNPFSFEPRKSRKTGHVGGNEEKRVIADFSEKNNLRALSLKAIDHHYEPANDSWKTGEHPADFIYLGSTALPFDPPESLHVIYDAHYWLSMGCPDNAYPLFDKQTYETAETSNPELNFLEVALEELSNALLTAIRDDNTVVLILSTEHPHNYPALRKAFIDLDRMSIDAPVIIKNYYQTTDEETFILQAATDIGGLLIDGFGDGLWTHYQNAAETNSVNTIRLINRTNFSILQATGARISKTEFIACPSCGRTQFDLQETTALVRAQTSHLKGVKIAVMGCIVNGPGEMADADYGYVGTGRGKVALYRGKEIVKRDLEDQEALDELINIIKKDGKWVEASN